MYTYMRKDRPGLTEFTLVDEPFWQQALLGWAKSVELTAAILEDKHSRNRSSCADGSGWMSFDSQFLNKDHQQHMRHQLLFRRTCS